MNDVIPSVTICLDQAQRDLSNASRVHYEEYKDLHTKCIWIADGNVKENKICDEIDPNVYLRYKSNSLCLTYFNDQRNLSKHNHVIVAVFFFYYKKIEIIFHPVHTPSHFQTKSVILTPGKVTMLEFKKYVIESLPSPYSTDCFDYSSNALNKIWPKSQTDCKLELMRQKERHICGQNHHWINWGKNFEPSKQVLNFSSYSNSCKVKYSVKLDKICKNECQTTEYQLKHQFDVKIFIQVFGSVQITSQKGYFKQIKYIGKISMLIYFSSIGGLISMWMGLSVVLMTDLLYSFLNRFLNFIYYSNINHTNNWSKKMCKLIKLLYKSVCAVLMFYQLFCLFQIYLDYPKSIEITFTDKLTFPKMLLVMHFETPINNNLDAIVEHIKCNIGLNEEIIYCPRPTVIFESFHENQNDFILHFLNSEFGKNFTYNYQIEKGLKKINLKFAGIYPLYVYIQMVNSLLEQNHHGDTAIISIKLHKTNDIYIESNNYRRITLENGLKCQNRGSVLFKDSELDYLISDCILNSLLDTFKCLPDGYLPYMYFKPDSYEMKFKFCPNYTKFNSSHAKQIEEKCQNSFLPDCEIQLFETQYSVLNTNTEVVTNETTTEINIIPVKTTITQYTEKYIMSFNDLFYDMGGTIGMWFGWSVISPPVFLAMINDKLTIIYKRLSTNYPILI